MAHADWDVKLDAELASALLLQMDAAARQAETRVSRQIGISPTAQLQPGGADLWESEAFFAQNPEMAQAVQMPQMQTQRTAPTAYNRGDAAALAQERADAESGRIDADTATGMDMEAVSRFFQRDARRYG